MKYNVEISYVVEIPTADDELLNDKLAELTADLPTGCEYDAIVLAEPMIEA